jgi:glycine cleavage system H lipoate-binding protein
MGTKRESMKIVPPGKKKCVWMEAGVVSYKLCDNNFDCPTCVYDQGMQLKVAKEKEKAAVSKVDVKPDKITESWVERMMKLPASRRKCRYMITGEVGRKICPNAYECGNCSFDQMMQARVENEVLPVHGKKEVDGFQLADDIYYHEGHTWAKPEYGGQIRVGLDDFARKMLGKFGSIDLPEIGHEVQQGTASFHVRRNGEVADILSPVDGIVSRVNERIAENPDLIKASPYEEGWLFVIEPTKLKKNLKALYYGEHAENFMGEEAERLWAMADEELRIAADGGASVDDVFEAIGGKSWKAFVKAFLRS